MKIPLGPALLSFFCCLRATETSLTVIERCSSSTPSDTQFKNSCFVLEVSSELYNWLNCVCHILDISLAPTAFPTLLTRWHSFTTVPSNAVPESSRVLFISQLFCSSISFQLLFGSLAVSQCKLKNCSCIYHGLMNVPGALPQISNQDKQLELQHVCPLLNQSSLAGWHIMLSDITIHSWHTGISTRFNTCYNASIVFSC